MAVVRITDYLKNFVVNKAGDQFIKAQKAAEALRPEIGQDVYNIVLKEFLKDTENIDSKYFHKVDSLNILVRGAEGGNVDENWGLDGMQAVPYGLPKGSYKWEVRGYHNTVSTEIKRDPQFDEIYNKVDAWRHALHKAAANKQAAIADVRKILDSFTTLAPALRAWPALWDLLPSDVQEKHKEIVERTKPEPVKVEITSNLEGLTAKLTMANISKKMEGK